MLLYLVKHLHPDHANVTRKLSKANNGVNPAAYKELLHVVKYVFHMEMLGFKIQPMGNSNEPWEIVCVSDSNYAGDSLSRQSISGFTLYVLGVPVSQRSKLQKSVSLSSLEAEYIALSRLLRR